jgi:hypothetical protein
MEEDTQAFPQTMLEAIVSEMDTDTHLTDSDDESSTQFNRIWIRRHRMSQTRRLIENRLFEEDTAVAIRISMQHYKPQTSTTTLEMIEKHFEAYKARHQKEKCTVCLEHLKRGDMMRQLPCFHYLHSDCLVGWFTQGNTVCPLCRYEVNFSKKRKR